MIRLIGADEHMYVSNVDAMQWIEDSNVLEMIVDKFSSSVRIISLSKSLLQDLDMLIFLNLKLDMLTKPKAVTGCGWIKSKCNIIS